MAGRSGKVRHKDIFTNTFELEEKVARKHLKSIFSIRRLTWVEQSHGSTNGAPDCWLTRGDGWGYLPMEIKKSYRYMNNPKEYDKPKYVQIRHVQPAQIDWHLREHKAGMTTIILVMLSEGTSWETSWWAIVEGQHIVDWMEGMTILKTCFGKDLAEMLGVKVEY